MVRYLYSILLCVGVILFHVLYIFQEQSFFDNQFVQLKSYERQQSVMYEAKKLMQYRGNTDGIVVSDVYTQVEKEHLYDVKKLIHGLEYVFLLCVLFTVVGWRRLFDSRFLTVFMTTTAGLLILFMVVFGLGWFAWDWLFVRFHELFFVGNRMFSGDSFLIQSYPWEFFRNAMMAVLIRSIVTLLFFLVLGYIRLMVSYCISNVRKFYYKERLLIRSRVKFKS